MFVRSRKCNDETIKLVDVFSAMPRIPLSVRTISTNTPPYDSFWLHKVISETFSVPNNI